MATRDDGMARGLEPTAITDGGDEEIAIASLGTCEGRRPAVAARLEASTGELRDEAKRARGALGDRSA
jgi:hypothetical protein